mmetsp:Transcript_31882/g.85240  ORF Transcript_31882/g.85240 Transcript_31882/m.85240 type:complete len:202 (-) Transcript_31882:406-1011(-)
MVGRRQFGVDVSSKSIRFHAVRFLNICQGHWVHGCQWTHRRATASLHAQQILDALRQLVVFNLAKKVRSEGVGLAAKTCASDPRTRCSGIAETQGIHSISLGILKKSTARRPHHGNVTVENQREILDDGQVAQQQSLRTSSVESGSHPSEHRIALLVGVQNVLRDVCLVLLERVHATHSTSLRRSDFAFLASSLTLISFIG